MTGEHQSDEVGVKRWTAKRKSAVVIDIFKGKITPVEMAWQHGLTVSEVEPWVEKAERNLGNGFRARPKEPLREEYKKALQETREALDRLQTKGSAEGH